MNELGAWAAAVTRLGKRELGLVATLFCVAALLLAFGLLAGEVMEGDTMAFDTRVARFFRPRAAGIRANSTDRGQVARTAPWTKSPRRRTRAGPRRVAMRCRPQVHDAVASAPG